MARAQGQPGGGDVGKHEEDGLGYILSHHGRELGIRGGRGSQVEAEQVQ